MKTKKNVRLAIIGTGAMAGAHADQYKKIAGCELVAACDVDASRVRAFSEQHGIPMAFSDTAELLAGADFDAVSVATPDAFHAPVSLACLKAGKHVLCEKPLALNYADAKKMVAAASRAGVVNMVNFSKRGAYDNSQTCELVNAHE